jgi:hypothetical protein
MRITRSSIAAPEATSTFATALVHFRPGARTAWHTQPHGAAANRFMAHLAMQQNDESGAGGRSA